MRGRSSLGLLEPHMLTEVTEIWVGSWLLSAKKVQDP